MPGGAETACLAASPNYGLAAGTSTVMSTTREGVSARPASSKQVLPFAGQRRES